MRSKIAGLLGSRLGSRDVVDPAPSDVGQVSAAPLEVLVKQGPQWWRTVLSGAPTPPQDLAELLPAGPCPTPDHLRPITPLPPDQLVTPAWGFAAEATADGWLVEDRGGRQALLDADDLRLLGSTSCTTRVDALVTSGAIADVASRAARLVSLGLLHVGAGPSRAAPSPAPDEAPAPTPQPTVTATGGPEPGGPPGRIPVYAIWHPEVGPLLALGMLTASARHHAGGALNETYEIRRPETAASFLADLATRRGPAVLLCSDYVWSLEANLEAARRARALNPDLVVIHGGPSSPRYEGEAEAFLTEHADIAHVLTRGEGEHMVCELLVALTPTLPALDPDVLGEITGLTFRHPQTGAVIRTDDRPRITDLDALPSPYLTGEFDHIDGESWNTCLSVETNRGCPYSCSFCDWGSSTLSRIRKFGLDRVSREVEWAAARGVSAINLPDANFGIMSRDVETASRIAEVKHRTGFPKVLVFYPAKNTTKHFVQIMDILGEAAISSAASLSLQTTDEQTLEALHRSNIGTDHFVALAADYRRRLHPLQGDLLLGIPGQTYDSYRRDLQFMLDQEILVRTWPVQILPNAPMNDPVYREEHQIRSDADNLIRSTSTFTEADRARMVQLRKIDIICERMGLLRHILRFVQWDHGIEATRVMDHLLDLSHDDPERFPHLSWTLNNFDLHAMAPAGWRSFYDEVGQMLQADLDVPASSALSAVIELNRFLMPALGRTFPDSLTLAHDYPSYYFEATRGLFASGHPTTPTKPLAEYGSARFEVEGDPLALCDNTLTFVGDSRNERHQGEFQIGSSTAYELQSPLVRLLPGSVAAGLRGPARSHDPAFDPARSFDQDAPLPDGGVTRAGPTPVTIGGQR